MSIEAMKQALEALEHIDNEDNDRDFLFPYQCTMLDAAITALRTAIEQAAVAEPHKKQEPAINYAKVYEFAEQYGLDYNFLCKVINDSLATPPAAPVQEPIGTLNIWFYKGHGNYDFDYWGSLGEGTYTVHVEKSEAPSHNSTCNETLRAQGKSYPRTCKKCGLGPCVGKPKPDTTSPAAPVQEPLEYWNAVEGWVKIDEVRQHFDSVGCGTIYKNAGEGRVPLYIAAQRQWVGLTQQDIDIAFDDTQEGGGFDEFARAIEQRLKEKNT